MRETFSQYKTRLQGYVGGDEPGDILRQTLSALPKLIARRPAELLAQRPKPEKWSIAEIMAHMADVEVVFGYRIRRVLSQPGETVEAFDQDLWAKALHYGAADSEKSVGRFHAMRVWNLDLLGSLTDEEWSRHGMHTERGRESVRDMTILLAGHDLNHTGQIQAILAEVPAPQKAG
jgi:uncharacterized damage-inducible protein DinB